MKNLRTFAWIGFFIILLFNIIQGYRINYIQCKQFNIIKLELASKAESKEYITYLAVNDILRDAKVNTVIDCVFILCYVIILISISAQQMQQQKSVILNSVLRFNLLLALITGICDYIENCILFTDFQNKEYISTQYISTIKFVIAGWVVLIWLISILRNSFVDESIPN